LGTNNSDVDLCEFPGRAIPWCILTKRMSAEFSAEAAYNGALTEFLQGYFQKGEDDRQCQVFKAGSHSTPY
jgi:hypothetical protein